MTAGSAVVAVWVPRPVVLRRRGGCGLPDPPSATPARLQSASKHWLANGFHVISRAILGGLHYKTVRRHTQHDADLNICGPQVKEWMKSIAAALAPERKSPCPPPQDHQLVDFSPVRDFSSHRSESHPDSL